MKDYDLLIAAHVVDGLLSLRKAERALLRAHFEEIRRAPGRFSDYTERDDVGRDLDINLFVQVWQKLWGLLRHLEDC